MFGQFWPAQAAVTERTGKRSVFPRDWGALASTGGAKLGRIVMAAAANAAIATAESALIMVRPLAVRARWPAYKEDAWRRERFMRR